MAMVFIHMEEDFVQFCGLWFVMVLVFWASVAAPPGHPGLRRSLRPQEPGRLYLLQSRHTANNPPAHQQQKAEIPILLIINYHRLIRLGHDCQAFLCQGKIFLDNASCWFPRENWVSNFCLSYHGNFW